MFPLIHPERVEANETADMLIFKLIYGINTRNALRGWIRQIPVLGDLLATIKRGMSR
jgi:hypothetical protein